MKLWNYEIIKKLNSFAIKDVFKNVWVNPKYVNVFPQIMFLSWILHYELRFAFRSFSPEIKEDASFSHTEKSGAGKLTNIWRLQHVFCEESVHKRNEAVLVGDFTNQWCFCGDFKFKSKWENWPPPKTRSPANFGKRRKRESAAKHHISFGESRSRNILFLGFHNTT